MTSTPIKDIGMTAVMAAGSAGSVKTANNASFEAVWSRQTDKNGPEPMQKEPRAAENRQNATVKDSPGNGDAKGNKVKEPETLEETHTEELREDGTEDASLKDMDPEDWEAAMEVLGAAVVELIQQIADSFGMTAGEVQDLMTELGMEQTDILQQENLGELLLAAGGAEDASELLTDGELYLQYQTLMEQQRALLEQAGETLQTDAALLAKAAAKQPEGPMEDQALPIEVSVEEGIPMEDGQPAEDDASVEEPGRKTHAVADAAENLTKDTAAPETVNAQTEKQTSGGTKHQETSAQDKGQNTSPVLQNFPTDNFDPTLRQLSAAAPAWDSDTTDIMRQIMDYMKIQVKPDMSDLEMQLHPASLGTLQIHVASRGGAVTAQFVAQNESVRAALESQMVQLKESFAEQGVKVDAIEVTVQAHQFEQNLEQGRGRGQNETDRRSKNRRIHLEGPLTVEELDGMEAEEKLSAQMMETNGNTVDYTA